MSVTTSGIYTSIWNYLFDEGFMPHGYCLLWRPDVFWTHVVSDLVIAISYFSIPFVLLVFAMRRTDLVHRWMLYLFGAFIVACGITHLMGVATMWLAWYGLEAIFKLITAGVSLVTAIMLWPLLPKLLALPSTRELEERNSALAAEVERRREAELALATLNDQLEERVQARTLELEEANTSLEVARAIAQEANLAKSRFLTAVSHELRTPMNAVLGFGQLMEMAPEREINEINRAYAGHITGAGRHLLSLIDDILDLSRIETGELSLSIEQTDLSNLLEGCAEIIRSQASEANITFSAEIDDALWVNSDPTRLRQVLLNLGSNAVKYNQAGGTVTLSAHKSGKSIKITVSDTGPGIPEEKIAELFEPFNRLGRENGPIEGTGIGLTIVDRICSALGAKLECHSEVGKGTSFSISLDGGEAPASLPEVKAGPVRSSAGARNILYVEDNPANVTLMRHVLTRLGENIQMHHAATAEEGLEMARELQPDLILMDIGLPDMNGLEALRHLRLSPKTTKIPAIAVTAAAMPDDVRRGRDAGFQDYVTKPFDIPHLVGLVRRMLFDNQNGAGGAQPAGG